MFRKLPIYLVIDCSFSMRGEPISMVNKGIKKMIWDLRKNPMALETVWLSIITFSTGAKQIIPLTELLQFDIPELIAEKRSDMGAALNLLIERIDIELILSTTERKGDWSPIVFLMTDGGSSDAWKLTADKIRERQNKGNLLFVAAGFVSKIYAERLARITPNVIISESSDT